MEQQLTQNEDLPQKELEKVPFKLDIFQAGIFIPFLALFSFIILYYYELGYFECLKLNQQLIRVEVTKNIHLIFKFLIIATCIFICLHGIYEPYVIWTRRWRELNGPERLKKGVKGVFVICIIVWAVFGWISYLTPLGKERIRYIAILPAMIGTLYIIVNLSFKNFVRQYSSIIRTAITFVVLISIGSIASYVLGLIEAKFDISDHLKLQDHFLIRSYEDYNIYGKFTLEKNNTASFSYFVTEDRVDTSSCKFSQSEIQDAAKANTVLRE